MSRITSPSGVSRLRSAFRHFHVQRSCTTSRITSLSEVSRLQSASRFFHLQPRSSTSSAISSFHRSMLWSTLAGGRIQTVSTLLIGSATVPLCILSFPIAARADASDDDRNLSFEAAEESVPGFFQWYKEAKSVQLKSIALLLSVNSVGYSAYSLSEYFYTKSKFFSKVNDVLYDNILLSSDNLKKRRWHVLVTYLFVHMSRAHLYANTLFSASLFVLVSPSLIPWGAILIFFSGGIVSGALTVFATFRDKTRYNVSGCSGALYSLYCYNTLHLLIVDGKRYAPEIALGVLLTVEAARSGFWTFKYLRGSCANPGGHVSHFIGLTWGSALFLMHLISKSREKQNESSSHAKMSSKSDEILSRGSG